MLNRENQMKFRLSALIEHPNRMVCRRKSIGIDYVLTSGTVLRRMQINGKSTFNTMCDCSIGQQFSHFYISFFVRFFILFSFISILEFFLFDCICNNDWIAIKKIFICFFHNIFFFLCICVSFSIHRNKFVQIHVSYVLFLLFSISHAMQKLLLPYRFVVSFSLSQILLDKMAFLIIEYYRAKDYAMLWYEFCMQQYIVQ